MKNMKKWQVMVTIFEVAAAAILILVINARPEGLRIIFLDIGQGDAILIQTQSGNDILIDGGPDRSVIQGLGEQLPFYDRKIELAILTHTDADHLTGLVEALDRYEIEKVVVTEAEADTGLFRSWQENLADARIERVEVMNGKRVILDDGVYLDILHPFEDSNMEGNHSSIVARLVAGKGEILLTGDIEEEEEARLLQENAFVRSDVLKVAHHGSKTSSTEDFLNAVLPDQAVISVGEGNRFGHPDPKILQNLEKMGIEVLRTDIAGDIILESDGTHLFFK